MRGRVFAPCRAARNAAVPFLGCPELLAIDRQRWTHDVTPVPDVFGLGNLQREPSGQATLERLKQRPSRRAMLDERLRDLAVEGPEDERQRVAQLLRDAAARLGPYGDDDDLGDAAFMAVHAGNLLVPENYTDVEVRLRDGRTAVGKQYVAPEAERRHMERLQSARGERSTGVNFHLAISAALEERRRSTPEFAASAAEWAQRPSPPSADDEENHSGLQQQAVVGAAMIAMRDLTGEQRARYRPWAMSAFNEAVNGEDDPVTRAREGLKFNPAADHATQHTRQGRDRHQTRRRVRRQCGERHRALGSLIPHAGAVGALMVAMIEAAFGTAPMTRTGGAD